MTVLSSTFMFLEAFISENSRMILTPLITAATDAKSTCIYIKLMIIPRSVKSTTMKSNLFELDLK